MEGRDCGFGALYSLKELDEILVSYVVLTDIKVVESLVVG